MLSDDGKFLPVRRPYCTVRYRYLLVESSPGTGAPGGIDYRRIDQTFTCNC